MAWKFLHAPPIITSKELFFPLGLTSNADFCSKDPNGSYPLALLHEPTSLTALCSSLKARGAAPPTRKPPFHLGPGQDYPIDHHRKGSFLFHLALHIFYFSTGIIVFVSIGPQIYACIKQGKLKTLVTTMALYKLPGTDALVPNDEHTCVLIHG